MCGRERSLDIALLVFAPFVAGGAMLLFFAATGGWVHLRLGDGEALAFDALLSLAFFLQHSGMVRGAARAWLARFFPERDVAAVYALASGLVLALVALLWQRTGARLLTLEGLSRWAARALEVSGRLRLRLGCRLASRLRPIWPPGHLGAPQGSAALTISAGHPGTLPLGSPSALRLHAPLLVVRPGLNRRPASSRCPVDGMGGVWTVLEERDLVAELGEKYREHRRRVPMLLPWRGPTEIDRTVTG